MPYLKVKIYPNDKEIIIPVQESICENVINMTKKIKPGWDFTPFEIPDIGFQGLELFCDNFIKIYIYEQNILYTHNNFIEFLKDPGKKIRNFLIKKVLYKCSELKFFYEKSIN